MRVVCDNCGATYKIPESKLLREVNKATCRKCGHQIIIRRANRALGGPPKPSPTLSPPAPRGGPPQYQGQASAINPVASGNGGHSEATVPRDVRPPPAARPLSGGDGRNRPLGNTMPPPAHGAASAPHSQTLPPPSPVQPPLMARPHDPAGDMSLVMMASFGAAIGAGVLATSSSEVQTLIGLGIALWSSITALLVLVTSDRGRKEARVLLSMLVALMLAGVGTVGFQLTGIAATNDVVAAAAPAPTTLPPTDPVEEPAVAEVEPEPEAPTGLSDAMATMAEDEPAVAEVEVEPEPEPAPKAKVESKPAPSRAASTSSAPRSTTSAPARSTTSSSSSSPPPRTTSSSSSTPARTTSPPPAATGVPLTVLDTMLRNNKGVKTCFVGYMRESGQRLSGRFPVKLVIEPNGFASYAAMSGGAHAGTSLDSCLSGAIRKIQFPPFSGEAASYTYPFVL